MISIDVEFIADEQSVHEGSVTVEYRSYAPGWNGVSTRYMWWIGGRRLCGSVQYSSTPRSVKCKICTSKYAVHKGTDSNCRKL